MPLATSSPTTTLPSSALVKMEEHRKRPAMSSAEDLAPPSKRQAVNGGSKSKDDAADDAWIEEFQKAAIYRQMQEYKRENLTLETRLDDLQRRAIFFDDHTRVMDAWWLQLLQEIELAVEGTIISQDEQKDFEPSTGLFFEDSQEFQRHLDNKARSIKSIIEPLLNRLATRRGDVKPNVADLESQISTILASQKDYIIKLDRTNKEKEELSEQLDTATLRYVKAEKRLDRAKSLQVQKLDQQALASSTKRAEDHVAENGKDTAETNSDDEGIHLKYQEAAAVVAKQKEQLEAVLSEIKTLQEENSSFKAHRESFTDEDYVRTDVFKQFKNQSEDLIRRINELEATNKQLRQDAEKLHTERSSFRAQLEREAQAVTGELEDQIQLRDGDLTRIRSARDELLADLGIRKASQEQERTALDHMKELVSASQDRIAALEMELERLRPSTDATISDPRPDIESLSMQELREKYLKLAKDFESINKELPSIEKAYKKTMGLAQKKVMDFTALEDKITLLTLEKSKADQKYFAARKDADIRINEIKTVRQQNGKSSEIISTLKDHDAQARALITNLEKQLTDLRSSNATILEENRHLKNSAADALRRAEQVKSQITDLQNLVKSKDSTVMGAREHAAAHETEVERLKVRLDNVAKERDTWKAKSLATISEDEEMLRNLALCTVCRRDFKDAVLKVCGHVFCTECLETRLRDRMRKCPTCSKAFDRSDIMPVYLAA